MTIEEMKDKVRENNLNGLGGWGFFDHKSGVSCKMKSGRFYFSVGVTRIPAKEAIMILEGTCQ